MNNEIVNALTIININITIITTIKILNIIFYKLIKYLYVDNNVYNYII